MHPWASEFAVRRLAGAVAEGIRWPDSKRARMLAGTQRDFAVAVPRQRITLPPGAYRRALAGGLRGDLWEGDDVARFEQAFAALIGAEDAVAVASGRAGLRFILDALEPGCEVICSAFGYPVVPFLVKHAGFQLKLVDCELKTLGMDPDALADAITDRTGAVIATHLYGVPCRIREIAEIAAAHGADLVEDCAHCCGASAGGRQTGTFGRMAYFSFETSKMINTLGGGMITTRDRALAAGMREAHRGEARRTFGWLAKRLCKTTFEATVTGPLPFNLGVYPALRFTQRKGGGDDNRFASGYHGDHVTMRGRTGRYTNYQARLGLAQLDRLPERLKRRVANARRLIDPLEDRVRFQRPADDDAEANYMLVTALFANRQAIGDELLRRGVDTKHHYMRNCAGLLESGETFPNAAQAEAEVLHLPAFPELSPARVDRIAETVGAVVDELRTPREPEAGQPATESVAGVGRR
jgi:dTDP-4-amino-4,6-dideoxygalactose transaminase